MVAGGMNVMPAQREAQTQPPDSNKSWQSTGSCGHGCWGAQQHRSMGHASDPALPAPRSSVSGTGAMLAHTGPTREVFAI